MYIPLRKIGTGGIVTDQDPYDLELTQFPRGNNVIFHEGRIGKTLGYTQRESLSFQPTGALGFLVNGAYCMIIGSDSKLYKYDGTTITDVTKTSDATTYGFSPRWQAVQLGSAVLFNNGGQVPQYFTTASTRFADLPNWPSTLRTQCIKPYKSFLVMVGYTDGGTEYPYTVRWSDEFDPASVPNDYDITSTTNLAGTNVLSGNYGHLVDQLTLGNTHIIYAERGVFTMDQIGGNLVFQFRDLFTDDGIINRGAVAEIPNKHLVVGQKDIYIHDGHGKQSIAEQRVRKQFYAELDDIRSVYCVPVSERSEVWICYANSDAPDERSANRALIYNWNQDAFTFIDLPNCRALTYSDKLGSVVTWDSLDMNWDEITETWDELSKSTEANNIKLFGLDYVNSKLHNMNSSNGAAGTTINAYLEATKLDLDAVLGKATNTVKQINQIMPQMEGTGTVTFKLGTSMAPQDPIFWKSSHTYNIETDHKIDTRIAGRYFALRIESDNNNGAWQLTGLDMDIAEVAAR
nr:phage particle protein [uncultured Mediterranean phage uvMED]